MHPSEKIGSKLAKMGIFNPLPKNFPHHFLIWFVEQIFSNNTWINGINRKMGCLRYWWIENLGTPHFNFFFIRAALIKKLKWGVPKFLILQYLRQSVFWSIPLIQVLFEKICLTNYIKKWCGKFFGRGGENNHFCKFGPNFLRRVHPYGGKIIFPQLFNLKHVWA